MRILCVGAGGLGGYFSARLAQAGAEVSLVARGAHLQALQASGLTLLSGDERLSVKIPAYGELDHIAPTEGAFDVILLSVKMYDIAPVAEQCAPLLAPRGIIITLQNGVEAPDLVAEVVARHQVFAGAAYASAHVEGPGVIRHMGPVGALLFGPWGQGDLSGAQAFAACMDNAGLSVQVHEDIKRPLWEKFIFFSAVSGLCGLTRQTLGALRQDPVIAEVLARAVAETAAVARATGIVLAETVVADTLNTIAEKPAALKPSLLVDLEKGRRLEVDWIAGAVHRLGGALGVETPVHSCLYAGLKPFSQGAF
jgi:2-dehydropantoate 2-reductase